MPISVDLEELKDLTRYAGDASDLSLFASHGEQVAEDHVGDTDALSTATKDMIGLYLAAHFYVLSRERGGLQRRRMGESEDVYKSVATDKVGFFSTRFGQTAVSLDTTKALQNSSFQWDARVMFETLDTGPKS